MNILQKMKLNESFNKLFELFNNDELLGVIHFLNRVLDRLETEKEVE